MLAPLFVSHPIVILTNTSLGHILAHSEATGRLVKWDTKLGKYDIEYRPRLSIKAQTLVDFLVETTCTEELEEWSVFVDGLSNSEYSDMGVSLVSSHEKEIKLIV